MKKIGSSEESEDLNTKQSDKAPVTTDAHLEEHKFVVVPNGTL